MQNLNRSGALSVIFELHNNGQTISGFLPITAEVLTFIRSPSNGLFQVTGVSPPKRFRRIEPHNVQVRYHGAVFPFGFHTDD
jgi:hypothetical protein